MEPLLRAVLHKVDALSADVQGLHGRILNVEGNMRAIHENSVLLRHNYDNLVAENGRLKSEEKCLREQNAELSAEVLSLTQQKVQSAVPVFWKVVSCDV